MVSNICLTCGSGAFKEVLIYCGKCKEYAQHAYCLDELEEYFRSKYTWYCEDCEEQMKSDTSISTHDLDDCESMDTEELLQISTPDSAGTSITPANGASKNLKVKKTKKLKKESKKKNISRSESVEKRVLEMILEANEEAEGNEVVCDQEGQVLEEEKFNAPDNVVPISPDDPLEITEDGHSTRVAAKPVVVPTWTGSLNIVNKVDYMNLRNVTVSGLVAHLSSLACPKVLEEVKFLKTHLEADLVRRTDVWPKGYDMCETRPSDRSIALYIFPDKKIDQKGFDNFVVSMKQEDLAMRVEIEKAELLLFTSQLLPEPYRRFKTNMYLWGVFKEKY